jgi:hypothetical protein
MFASTEDGGGSGLDGGDIHLPLLLLMTISGVVPRGCECRLARVRGKSEC